MTDSAPATRCLSDHGYEHVYGRGVFTRWVSWYADGCVHCYEARATSDEEMQNEIEVIALVHGAPDDYFLAKPGDPAMW